MTKLSFIVMILLMACSKPLPELDNIDLGQWKDDHQGCLGIRMQYLDALREQRTKLKGLSEWELVKLIGKPDRNDLTGRHEKFYYYYIEASDKCKDGNEKALKLIVRFNAVGLSREVAIE